MAYDRLGGARVAGVLLAAGAGRRFGGNKLEARLGEDLLGCHAARTLAGIGCESLFAVHDPAHAALASLLADAGFALIENRDASAGLSHSLALATQAAMATDAEALLIMLADMPFVTAEHLGALLAAHVRDPDLCISSQASGVRMPPAIFPRALWSTLASASGDAGARPLLQAAVAVPGPVAMLRDIDVTADLERANEDINFRSRPVLLRP